MNIRSLATLSLNKIIKNFPGHIYWKDLSGVYLGCNNTQAKNLGLKSGSDVVGETDFELPWPKLSAETFRENDLEVIKHGKAVIVEEPATIEGITTTVLSHKVPLKDAKGKIVGVLGLSIDLTSQKETEAQLIAEKEQADAANRAKSEFITNLSHDIRTPITGILGLAHSLQKRSENKQNKEDAGLLIDVIQELLALLNQTLSTNNLDNTYKISDSSDFSIQALANHNVALLAAAAKHKGLSLKLEIDKKVPEIITGNRAYLDRVILNLLSNAIKFTHQGHIELSITPINFAGDKVTLNLMVKDSGIGIPQDKMSTIFENFSQVDSSSSQGLYKGNGLGLHAVKKYLDSMHGDITVISEEGKGSVFIVETPFTIPKKNL